MYFYLVYLKMLGCNIIGTPRYIGVHTKFDDLRLIEIGDKTTISDECHLLTHDYSITNVMRAVGKEQETDISIIRGIKIGTNCFIGKKSIIMPNTEIGDNVIIGAGSVVRGKIPANTIWIGNPAVLFSSVEEQFIKWSKYLNIDCNKLRRD